jgi:predicted ATP-dependent endonuclease of OLD family
MQLVSFRIQNFRSIVDTGWHQLAHDNITSLIGQNESGKTSILEALKAFHDGRLIEDMLRSDLSLPVVSCKFSFNFSDIENHIDKRRLNPEIRKLISSVEIVSLTRRWEDELDSHMEMGDELQEFYNEMADQFKKRELKVMESLEHLNTDIALASKKLNKVQEEADWTAEKMETVRLRMNEIKRNIRKFPSRERKEELKKELELEEEMYLKLKETLELKHSKLEEKRDILEALEEKNQVSTKLNQIQEESQAKKEALSLVQEQLKQLLQMTGMYATEREQRTAEIREEIFRSDIEKHKDELEILDNKQLIQLLALEYVFDGKSIDEAVKEARKEVDSVKEYYSSNELAEEIFKILPDFEMFEDFSSLLPNRIDLEDIIRANKRAEGYKAAINFLTITGLEYSFFQQPSSRILKQKIENLNGELTLNFQDFWRQNVGKNNKININFELSHYDHTIPEKSGKPFIEFWIKDEQERLYPKQRSRGVRWFLSFFLELKATAMDKSKRHKVLLIDEPAVSLHARAQEDVLKVFDDIKERIQIIYTTHSPHLIDVNKLYRILAVQRAVEDDMKSETLVYSARSLKSATADTLSPIYSTMGARLNQQEIIKSFNNVIVKDLATYYFMKAVVALTGFEKECYFLPASGAESIPMMVNILMGWGIDYVILNFGNSEERQVYEKLMKEQYENKIDEASKQMLFMEYYPDAEDLFSTIDFKKHVVKVREGITVKNSEYLIDNNYSRAILASNFLQDINGGKVSFKTLDDETRDNLNSFIKQLSAILK